MMADRGVRPAAQNMMRQRDGHHAKVTYEELFFDLVYVFAVTQISHVLLHHLTLLGALQTLTLWFAVWLGWQYTCWVTNWFDPEHPRLRLALFLSMLLALVMAAAIPEAFGERGLVFALCYVAMQVGRTLFILVSLGRDDPLVANYRRMAAWLAVSACFWIAGALAEPNIRLMLWMMAVACEYVSPMFGFAFPGMGRSQTRDWTIEGGHLAERCQLFVIVALGETLLATGATLADAGTWTAQSLSALGATFLGTLALWWLYFGTSSKDATTTITHSDDPGRIGASLHYSHAVLISGVIVCAVGNDMAMEHPGHAATWPQAITLAAGPIIYLVGTILYRRVVYGGLPRMHAAALALALLIAPVAILTSLLTACWIATGLLTALAFVEHLRPRGAKEAIG
jgi:low temperature requirement protein LtrA